MNIERIATQIVGLPDTGCDQEVALKIAMDTHTHFMEGTRDPQFRRSRQKHCADLPRTVIRTLTHCVYMLQKKGGISLLGHTDYSKVGRVIVVRNDGRVTLESGRVVFLNIEQAIESNEGVKKYDSPYLDKAAWLVIKYRSEKKGKMRALFVREYYAFNADSLAMYELPNPEKLSLLADIAEGIAINHEDRFVHNDIKPSNFRVRLFFDATGRKRHQGVLADHDFRKKVGSTKTQGSVMWMAPESFEARCLKVNDMWSFGLSMYQILNKKFVEEDWRFPDFILQCAEKDKYSVFKRKLRAITDQDLTEKKLFPEGWSLLGTNRELEALIKACLSLDPKMRPLARVVSQTLRTLAEKA